MIPGESIIRRCPSCGGSIRQRTLVSGNTFGARLWTDGKMDAPMLPRYPPLVRCPHCAALLWLPAAEEVGTEHPGEAGTPGVEDPPTPTVKDLLEASRTPPAGAQDEEVFIRIEAWHAANDPQRRDPRADPPRSTESEANMEALSRLLDPKEPEQRIMKAELHRELGLFDEAERLLDFPFDEDLAPAARFIGKLTLEQDRRVTEVVHEQED